MPIAKGYESIADRCGGIDYQEPTLAEIYADAGLLRQHLGERYSNLLTHGGNLNAMTRLGRKIRRLARLAGISQEQAWQDLRADVEALDAECLQAQIDHADSLY